MKLYFIICALIAGRIVLRQLVPQQLFLGQLFLFVTMLRTAVKTTISEVDKLFRTGGAPTSLTLLFSRWLTGLFGLYGSERAYE